MAEYDDYNMAKPDPFAWPPQRNVAAHDPWFNPEPIGDGETTQRIDHTGFVAGVDRMKTAPEFLADTRTARGHLPFDGPPVDLEAENARLREEVLQLSEALTAAVRPVTGETSDGYHTFNELYDHRRALTAALLAVSPWFAWRAKAHHPDDTPIHDGMFIVGLDLPTGVISYHYNLERWDDFSEITVLPYPVRWDGAPPAETVTRLLAAVRP